jgi:two-component system phosphate regulon sensor histidine kinase PhoR
MRRRKLLWHIFPSYLLITVIAVTAVSWYSFDAVRRFYLEETAAALTARALLLEERARPLIGPSDADALDSLAKELGAAVSTRITVIAPNGVVIADSEEDPAVMDNHGDRPEIVQALTGEVGRSSRYSYTLETNMMYVAVPVSSETIALAALFLLVLSAVVSLAVSRRIALPLHHMQMGAERFAKGDLEHTVPVPDTVEFASLAESLNTMAAELDERIRAVVQQKAEQEAVFAGMTEGVAAVDREERIITLNRAAARMFGIEADAARGRAMQEIIRSTAFHEIAGAALDGEGPIERQMAVGAPEERILEAHAAPLRSDGQEISGAVIVLNDVTKLRRLENVRKDFVANVSHELRTPITSIKGFVETLRDGLDGDAGQNGRFLEIIAKHVDRLNAIIEDLLYLSRIEEDTEQTNIVLEHHPVADLLRQTIDTCVAAAAQKSVEVRLSADESLTARVSWQLMGHAIANLLDNAIKYSDAGGVVDVEAAGDGGEVVISVRDHGTGIAEEHQSRIFERFYQVDKSRSREMGGTGLGLSIAKHIVHAHGGTIAVQSILNQGSTFSIHLPANGRLPNEAGS